MNGGDNGRINRLHNPPVDIMRPLMLILVVVVVTIDWVTKLLKVAFMYREEDGIGMSTSNPPNTEAPK